jgi:hypothetical protein
MPTLEEVQMQLKKVNVTDTFGTKKEIKELPNILAQNEEIKYVTSGLLDGNTWLITCTNKRILFLDKGMVYGLKQMEIPLEKINSIGCTKGLLLGKIEIWDGASKKMVDAVANNTVKIFVDAVNDAREVLKDNNSEHKTSEPTVQNDIVSQLERITALKEKGILNDDEFQMQKQKILNS